MSEEVIADDSSHYEVSLTGGQAFVAFVLLLFSLAASFAFGLMVGKGQVDERLVVKREPSVISEGAAAKQEKATEARIVELGRPADDQPVSDADTTPAIPEVAAPTIVEETSDPSPVDADVESQTPASSGLSTQAVAEARMTELKPTTKPQERIAEKTPEKVIDKPADKPADKPVAPAVAAAAPAASKVAAPTAIAAPAKTAPVYAQVLSSTEARAAETLAARLIDSGFTSAYVERTRTASAMTYRVRVRFSSEDEARAATARLRSITKSEPWITKQ